MSKAIDGLRAAQTRGMGVRPAAFGFLYFAEALRQGGVSGAGGEEHIPGVLGRRLARGRRAL